MNPILIFHNITFLLGGLINIIIVITVFFLTRKKSNVTATTFALSSLAVAVFQFSHLLGTNAPDPVTSRFYLMFNTTDLFIGMFMTHWFLGLVGKDRKLKNILILVYASGLSIFTACMIWPKMFLVNSVPKLFLPYYYEPGPLYYVMFFWFIAVSIFHFSQLIIAYRQEQNVYQKNRYKYILYAMVWAYVFGTTTFLLVFDIPFNPALSSVFGFYPLVIVYAILQYEVFDIRVFAKKAFVYAGIIIIVGMLVTFSDALSGYAVGYVPNTPSWVVSALISIILGGGAIYVWRKSLEAEVAKYEFITTVTHKFKTPLTKIRWAAEEIGSIVPLENKEMVEIILKSERQLLELTDMLVGLSDSNTNTTDFVSMPVKIKEFLESIKSEFDFQIKNKKIILSVDIPEDFTVLVDESKLKFVFEVLLNNAINYTNAGGSIVIRAMVENDGGRGKIEIQDSGIGMSKETLANIFSRFYRGSKARSMDTEGMGISLFIARKIIKKQKGNIQVESAGEGKGSSFFLELPIKS